MSQPSAGTVGTSPNVRIGCFGQTNFSRLHPQLTVEQEISDVNRNLHRTKIRAIRGTTTFGGNDALKKESVLSGGEKSRVGPNCTRKSTVDSTN